MQTGDRLLGMMYEQLGQFVGQKCVIWLTLAFEMFDFSLLILHAQRQGIVKFGVVKW